MILAAGAVLARSQEAGPVLASPRWEVAASWTWWNLASVTGPTVPLPCLPTLNYIF